MATVETLPSAAPIPAHTPGAKQPSIWNILDVILIGLVHPFSMFFANVCFIILLIGLTAVTLDSFMTSGLMGLSEEHPWIYQAYNAMTTALQAALVLSAIAAKIVDFLLASTPLNHIFLLYEPTHKLVVLNFFFLLHLFLIFLLFQVCALNSLHYKPHFYQNLLLKLPRYTQ